MAGRPRTSSDPHADRWRTRPDAELADDATKLTAGDRGWLPETKRAFQTYAKSQAARVLREEDHPDAIRLFDYRDRLARALKAIDNAEDAGEEVKRWQNIKQLESMVLTLSNHLGIGPAARARLGVQTNVKPGSRLNSFLRRDDEPDADEQ